MGDLSALIFVALAVAWAAYLVPKAIRHHAEADESRSVESFSSRVRVLAARQPISRKEARLVTADSARADSADSAVTAPSTPAQLRARRERARRAAQRRRRVLGLLLIATTVVGGLAGYRVFHWAYVGIPMALLIAWLVACRLMVKGEQRVAAKPAADRDVRRERATPRSAPSFAAPAPTEVELDGTDDVTEQFAAVSDEVAEAEVVAEAGPDRETAGDSGAHDTGQRSLWDPVPMTLPTYVSKPAAGRRTIRAIELDSTGVWTSGRTERDAQLAREADAAAKEAKAAEAEAEGEERAVGS